MADIQSNININVDTTNAMAAIRGLQSQISAFHQQMQKSGSAANAASSANMQRNLVNSINSTKKFSASIANVSTETESFTNSLEKNKLSMGQYFRFAGASSKTFGKMFRGEFNTISKVAESRVRTLQTQYVKMGRDASGAMKAIKVRPLALDMNNLSTQTMIAAQKQQIFNQLLRQGSTNLLNFGKNTQWAGRQLMVGFTVPLSIMGMMAIKEFKKIEEQVIRLKRVYGDMFTTNAETEKAVEQVRELADEFTKYGIAVESTIGLAASVAQMGNMGADMINQVTEASKLAILGGMEQEKALQTTVSLTNAFGIATEDLTEKINFLNAAENQTILAIDDFTEAVPKAGSVVAQLGGSVEDLAFFLTAMREGGVNASQAANALKSSLARLINPTQQARDDLNKLGIDVISIVEGNVGDLRGTIIELGGALDELQPLERSRALEELFGKFQFARMSTLFQNISKEGSQAQEILKLTRNSAAELQIIASRELSRVEESPATKLQKSIEKLQASLAPIGAEFAKLITPLVEFFTGLLKKFNEMDAGAKSFVTGLVTVLGLIAPVAIMGFGLIANGIANLMKAFNAYRSFLQILSGSNRDVTTTTQYMTQEQLEAASVATNLGQSHQFLSQQFTVEASALQELTNVYRAANTELMRFNATTSSVPARPVRVAPPVTRATAGRRAGSPAGPVGYNKGTLNVPGPRGAGDIVPAVLSPGEAVIPARQSQKYSSFLEAIMSDEVPGMFFGGIAGMLGRSRVATRMNSGTFMSSLRSKDMSYKSGFATGTGADFTDRLGRPMKQHQLMRRQAEKNLYGVPTGVNDPARRPTYGSVAMSPLQRILSLLFGGRKGRQFASVTNPMSSSLDQYGDISLIGKRSMNQRASTFAGDTLLKYSKNPAWVRGTAPMRGATAEQMKTAGFGAFDTPFGQNKLPGGGTSVNPQLPYIEAQTMGGFNYNEVSKIVTKNPAVKRQLKSELRAAGLGNIKVGGPGFLSSLMTRLGVPGFENGIFNVPGPKGAGDIIPAMLAPGEAVVPAAQTQKYAGLIKGIISDNIPGFEQGRVTSKGKTVTMPPGSSISANTEVGAKKLQGEIEKLIQGFIGLGRSVEQAEQEVLQLAAAAEKGGSVRADDLAQQARTDAPGASMAANNTMATRTSMGRSPAVKGNEGAASLHVTDPTPMSEQDKSELGSQLESQGFGDSDAATKVKAGGKVSAATDATVIAPAIMNKSGKVSGNQASEIVANTPGMATSDLAAATNLDPNDPVFQQAEQNMQNYLGAMGDEILTDKQIAEALKASILDAADSVGGSSGKKVRSQMSQNKVLVGGRGTTEDRRARVALPAGFKGETSSGISAEGPQPGQKTYLDRGTVKKFHAKAEKETVRLAKDLDQQTQKKKPRRSRSEAKTVITKDAQSDAQVYSKEFDAKSKDPYLIARDNRNSPHPQSGKDGAADARSYDKGFKTQSGAPVPPGQRRRAGAAAGAPPPLPVSPGGVPQPGGFTSPIAEPLETPEGKREAKKSAKGFVQRFGKGVKNAGSSVGKKAMNSFEKSTIGQNFVSRLGAAAGNTVVGSDGNVIYDANKDVQYDSQGNAIASGMAAGQAGRQGAISEDIVVGPDGNPVVDKKGRPVSQKQADKQVRKMASRQKRGMVAGRLGGAMGSASMMLGMSSMMPGVGDNPIMQQIQGFMPALFGLSAVLPLLAALPGPLGLLVGVVGAVVAGLVIWNQELKKTRKEYRELGESLSSGTQVMDSFAQAAGTVTPNEIMNLRRSSIGEQVTYAVGKTPFATNFFEGEDGQQMLESFNRGSAELGSDFATDAFARQLSTAVYSGILSREQAGQLALELGNQIDDYGVSIKVAAELNQMFGPNGEKLLDGDPLQIFIDTSEKSVDAFGLSVDAAIKGLGDQGFLRNFLNFDDAAIESYTAGAITGFIQEQENSLNAFEVASDKKIEGLKEQAAELESQGEDASDIYAKIDAERTKQEENRVKALEEYENTFEKIAIKLDGKFADIDFLSKEDLDRIRTSAQEEIDTEISNSQMPLEDGERQARINVRYQKLVDEEAEARGVKFEGGVFDSFVEGLNLKIEETLPESMRDSAKAAVKTITDMDLSIPASLILSTSVAAGKIDPTTLGLISEILTDQGSEPEAKFYFDIIGDVAIKGGPQAIAQIDSIFSNLDMFGETDEDRYQVILTLLEDLRGIEGVDLSNTLDQLTFFSTFSSILGDSSMINFLNLSDKEKREIQNSIDLMEGLVDSTPDEPLTVEQVIDQKILVDQSAIDAFKADAKFFEALDPIQQFLYISRFVAIQSTITEDQAIASLMNKGTSRSQFGSGPSAEAAWRSVVENEQSRLGVEKVKSTINVENLLGNTGDGEETPDDPGGGPVGSMLDSLTSKLKLVRDETVKFTKGWSDSMKQLQSLFGGDRTITIFDGLQQSLRSLGAGENLIELIAGMDPDEFEKRKNELFTIKKGQIVALKDSAKSIGDALNSIKIGEFQNSQERTLSQMENQEVAFKMLREAGLEVADAYSVIADEALAAAIASGQLTDVELDELISKIEEVREKSEVAEAFENVRKEIEKFNRDLRIRADVDAYVNSADFNSIQGSLINGQVDGALAAAAILKDESLKALIAAGKAGSEEFTTRLSQVMNSAEFLQGIFDKGYSNVQEAFKVQEAKIRDDFETRLIEGTLASYDFDDLFGLEELSEMIGMSQAEIEELFQLKDPEGVIEQAKEQIATLEYQIDDLEAELDNITEQEDEINEKYEKRNEALDEIESSNEAINRLQESQLSISDALTRGDISAAARAVQEAKKAEAQARLEDRRKQLEAAQEAELEKVRSDSGKSRKEIEEDIKEIKKEISQIEEESLEPATRLLELSDTLLGKQLFYNTVLGKTREEWEDIKLEVDLAKIQSDKFVDSIKAALSAVQALIDAYRNLNKEMNKEQGAEENRIPEEFLEDGITSYTWDPETGQAILDEDIKTIGDLPKEEQEFLYDWLEGDGNQSSSSSGNNSSSSTNTSSGSSVYQAEGVNVTDRNKAAAAAVGAVKSGQASDPLSFANSVKANIEANRDAVRSGNLSASDRQRAMQENIKLMQDTGLKFAVGGMVQKFMGGGKIKRYANGGSVDYLAGGGLPASSAGSGKIGYFPMGGLIPYKRMGGLLPYKANGGLFQSVNTDTVPAMLTPGEFVVRRYAVDKYGTDTLKSINNGTYNGESMYNYNLNINVKSDANPDDIARVVMTKIKQVDSQRMRSNRF